MSDVCAAQDQLVADTYRELQAAQRAEASAAKGKAKSAAKKRRKVADKAYKAALKAQRKCQSTAKTQIRQEARTARTAERQKPENVKARQEAIGKLGKAVADSAAAVGAAYVGAGTGAPVDPRSGTGAVSIEGSASIGGDPNDPTPLYLALGIAGLGAAYLLFR